MALLVDRHRSDLAPLTTVGNLVSYMHLPLSQSLNILVCVPAISASVRGLRSRYNMRGNGSRDLFADWQQG